MSSASTSPGALPPGAGPAALRTAGPGAGAGPQPEHLVSPTLDDPDVAASATALGGPVGEHAEPPRTPWFALRVATVVVVVGHCLAVLARMPCVASGFAGVGRYTRMCYSDIPVLYTLRGFSQGMTPYLDTAPGVQQFEYPVLTGVMAQIGAWLTPLFGGGGIGFYAANVLMIGLLLVLTVVATGLAAGPRPWDAVLIGAAPALLVTSTINWDALAVALVAVWLLLWSRRVVFWSGVVLGLAIAAKFYPVVFLGPMLLLCLRAGKLPSFGRMLLGTVVGWAAANVPVMLANFEGWATFYTFSEGRGQDFGSPWLALSIAGAEIPADAINAVGLGLFALLCAGLAVFILRVERRPRVAPMLFCVLAAFLLTNKVYSPQYVMWLVPLAVLALPRLRYLVVWQVCELTYFAAIWLYLAGLESPNRGLPTGWYSVAIWIHVVGTAWFAAMLLRDALHPRFDPVRTPMSAADPPGVDDPAGGVLTDAPDRLRLGARRATLAVAQ